MKPVPVSPQRILLGIDRGKKASDVSLKNPWKPPTVTPPRPQSTFSERLASVVRDSKRKSAAETEREKKKSKSFSVFQHLPPENTTSDDEWCKYTGFNLRTRVLSQETLKEEFKRKTCWSISDLYRLVTPPSYNLPEIDTADFVVTGIVGSKSDIRQIRNRDDDANYLVVKITDLKVPLFLSKLI
jgi:hypothetical protein